MQFRLRSLLAVVTGFALVAGLARFSVANSVVARGFGGLAWVLACRARRTLEQEGDFNRAIGVMFALITVPVAILCLLIAIAAIIGYA